LSAERPPPFIDRFMPGETIRFEVNAVLHESRSAFQQIQVLDLAGPGRALILDGEMQSAERDERLYHEALIQPALLSCADPGPRSVLILGGGEGASLREVLRHESVRRAVMVDLDRDVVEACREHLPGHHAGAFDDPRAELRFEDAAAFLTATGERFDAIIFDIIDPKEDGPACHLFREPFFETLRARLNPGGLLAIQYGPAFPPHLERAAAVLRRLRRGFEELRPGAVFVPSFHGSWGVALASSVALDLDPATLDRRIAARLPAPLFSLDGAGIAALLTAPRRLRELLLLD